MFFISATWTRWALILVSVFSVFILIAPQATNAQDTKNLCTGANLTFDSANGGDCNKDASGNAVCKGGNCAESSFNKIVKQIVNIFSIIVGIAAVIMIIYGGFRYITSGGDSGNISTAKNIIIYAIVGLVIVAFAQVIVKFVLDKSVNTEDTPKQSSLMLKQPS